MFCGSKDLSKSGARHRLGDEDAEKLDKLERLSRLEADQNRDDSAIYFGRELHFSDAFQLLHVKSNRYLKVLSQEENLCAWHPDPCEPKFQTPRARSANSNPQTRKLKNSKIHKPQIEVFLENAAQAGGNPKHSTPATRN